MYFRPFNTFSVFTIDAESIFKVAKKAGKILHITKKKAKVLGKEHREKVEKTEIYKRIVNV